MRSNKEIVIIGAGFAGLSAACYLAKMGFKVTILEKNTTVGGRARQLNRDGFTFDIGPTFYWMPDVFERFFKDFGKAINDYYNLQRLDPSYQVVFGKGSSISLSADFEKNMELFESIEKGSGQQLSRFMDNAKSNYDIAIKDLVYQPGEHIFEIINQKTIFKIGSFFQSIQSQVASYVKDSRLRKILEFPVLFLGAKPSNTPSFYNFMNYADFHLGTWHPKGGMFQVVKAMQALAEELGVQIITNANVTKIETSGNKVNFIHTDQNKYACDIVLSGADYHFTESLLPQSLRQYSEKYWDKKVFAPSALLFYVGFDKKLQNLAHHTLFFDTDFEKHAESIYDTKTWSEDPLFYASFPSMTDAECAPSGQEAAIFLIPIAPGLEDGKEIREKYFEIILDRIEYLTDQKIRKSVIFKESFCVSEFISEYNSYKGNAYGLANTLFQTHILRPRLKSKKINNLYFTGQLTVPGPGVPPSLISGKIVSDLIRKYHS